MPNLITKTRFAAARRRAGGFTLIEASLTTVIIGVGVLAIVAAQQAYHMKNQWAQRTATGYFLANEIRELMLPQPVENQLRFDGERYGHGTGRLVISALDRPIEDLVDWRQEVTVQGVNYQEHDGSFAAPGLDGYRIQVAIYYKDQAVTGLAWVVLR